MTKENLSEQTEILNTKARPAENLDERTVEEQKSTLKQFYSEIKKGVEAGTIKVLNKENTKGKRLKASVTDTHGDVVSLIVSLVNCGAEPEENKFLYYVDGKYYYKDESTEDKKYHEYNPYGNPKIGNVVEDKTIIKNIENNSTVVPFFNTTNAIELNHLGDVIDRGSESLTSILICETCDNLKLIQGNHEFDNSVSDSSQLSVINNVLARMKKNKKIVINRYEGKGNKVVAYSHTPLTQIGISCIFDFLNDYIRGDLFDKNGKKVDLSVKSNVFNALDKEFKNHKNLFNKLQTFLLNCEKSNFKGLDQFVVTTETKKKLTQFYKKIINKGNFTKEELLIIKNIVGNALDNRKIDDNGKKKFGEDFSGNYEFSKLILKTSDRGYVNVLNFYDKEYELSICEHIGGHTPSENVAVVNKKTSKNGKKKTNNEVLFLNTDILRTNGKHEDKTYALTTIIDENTGEVENYTCIVGRGKDNEILDIRENENFKCLVTKLENYTTKPFEKDKTEFYDFANDVSKTTIDKNGEITITFNNNQEITLSSLDDGLDCIGRNAVFAIFANENNLDIKNEKHKGVIDSLLSTLMEQENNRHKRDLINMVLSNCNNVDIIGYVLNNEKVKSFIEENEKTIEKNEKTIEKNEKTIEKNEKTIEENKKTIEENKKNKTNDKNKELIEKNKEFTKENEKLEEENTKLTEENRTTFLNAFLLNKDILDRGNKEEINKAFESIGIKVFKKYFEENIVNESIGMKANESIGMKVFKKYFEENIANNEEEKNKFFSVLISSDNSYLLEYLNNNKLLNEQDYKTLLEKGAVYNRTKIFDKVCEITNSSVIKLFENNSLKNDDSEGNLSEEESEEEIKIKDLLKLAIENENVDIFNKIFSICKEKKIKIKVGNEIGASRLLETAIRTKNKELINKVIELFKSENISIGGENYSSEEKKQDLQNFINTAIFELCSETDKTNEEENKYIIDIFKKLNNAENISDIDLSKISGKHELLNVVLATNDSALIEEVIGVFEKKRYFKEINSDFFRTLLKNTKNIDTVKKLLDIYKNQNSKKFENQNSGEFENLIANTFNLKKFLVDPLILVNDTERINTIFEAYIEDTFEVKDDYKEKNVLNLLKLAIKRENMEIFNNIIVTFKNKSFKYGLIARGEYTNKKNLKELLDYDTNTYKSLIDEAKKTNNTYVIKTVEEKLNEIENSKEEELEEKVENNENKVNDDDIANNSSNNPNSDSNPEEERLEENTDIINSNNKVNDDDIANNSSNNPNSDSNPEEEQSDSTEISEEVGTLKQLILDLSDFRKNGEKRKKEKNILVSEEKKDLINRYNSYVKGCKELKLKTIEIKEKNKYFHKKNRYMYVEAKKLDSVIEALKGQQNNVDIGRK